MGAGVRPGTHIIPPIAATLTIVAGLPPPPFPMQNSDASTIAESIQAQLGSDTGFITSAVVSFSTVDGEGQERIVVVYDGTLLAAAKLAEYSADRLEQIIYNGKPDDADEAP